MIDSNQKQILVEQLRASAKESVRLKSLIEKAKTAPKRAYYNKKLAKNNTMAVGLLLLLEQQSENSNSEPLEQLK